jgi:predicted DNA-binding transcriptional regulator YafY
MTPHFSRHEQFLRILTLLEILANARQTIPDDSLIDSLKDRLGLSRLSVRTLHRDCEFLMSCGYPLARTPLPGGRKHGWRLERGAGGGRWMPDDPTTLLELVAFLIGRELLRAFEGTVLWTGIEALRHKIERSIPQSLRDQVEATRRSFHVSGHNGRRYAPRPRLLSTLATATTDRRLIELTLQPEAAAGHRTAGSGAAGPGSSGRDGAAAPRLRLRPLRVVIRAAEIHLLGLDDTERPRLIDLARIDHVVTLDATFEPPELDIEAILAG